jgi:hypothetical protein
MPEFADIDDEALAAGEVGFGTLVTLILPA